MGERKREPRPEDVRKKPAREDEEPAPPTEKVDEASWESFPASDPPSFTPEKTG